MHAFTGRDDASPVTMEGEGELGGANKVALSIGTEQPQFVKVLKKYHDYGMVLDFAYIYPPFFYTTNK